MDKLNLPASIKSAIPMLDAVRFYGYEPNFAGFIRCPFHGSGSERTASMKLYPGERGFCCFGCNTAGSVIDFVMKLFNLSFRDACARLNADFHLGIDLSAPVDTDELRRRRAAQAEKKRRQELFDAEYRARCDEYRRLRWAYMNKAPTIPSGLTEAERIEAMCAAMDSADAEFLEALGKLDALEWWLHENLGRRG